MHLFIWARSGVPVTYICKAFSITLMCVRNMPSTPGLQSSTTLFITFSCSLLVDTIIFLNHLHHIRVSPLLPLPLRVCALVNMCECKCMRGIWPLVGVRGQLPGVSSFALLEVGPLLFLTLCCTLQACCLWAPGWFSCLYLPSHHTRARNTDVLQRQSGFWCWTYAVSLPITFTHRVIFLVHTSAS